LSWRKKDLPVGTLIFHILEFSVRIVLGTRKIFSPVSNKWYIDVKTSNGRQTKWQCAEFITILSKPNEDK